MSLLAAQAAVGVKDKARPQARLAALLKLKWSRVSPALMDLQEQCQFPQTRYDQRET